MNNFEENRLNRENENYFLQSQDKLEKNQQEFNEHLKELVNEDAAKGLLNEDDLDFTPEEKQEREEVDQAYHEVMGKWSKKNSP